MQAIYVKMNHVELTRPATDLFEHDHVVWKRVLYPRVGPQGRVTARDQFGGGKGVAAGEQCDIVALADQLFGEVVNDALRAAIEPRRHALDQRRDLSDLHVASFPFESTCDELKKNPTKEPGILLLTFPRARRLGTARRPAQKAGLLRLQPRRRHGDVLVTETRAGGRRLADFCHSPGASQRLLAAAPRLPSGRASQHVPVHAGHW